MFVPHQLLFSYLPYIPYTHGLELPHVAGTLPPMTDLLLNSANLSPAPPRCIGGIEEGGLAEPFRGRNAEAVPCWLALLSYRLSTDLHKWSLAVLLHTYCQGALTDMFECLRCYVQY